RTKIPPDERPHDSCLWQIIYLFSDLRFNADPQSRPAVAAAPRAMNFGVAGVARKAADVVTEIERARSPTILAACIAVPIAVRRGSRRRQFALRRRAVLGGEQSRI
ncbi:MAG: hypothetical protein JWR13_1044, partial [Mycobacterium sp.]|nr:hypothetical protein [Mycobacterium sp.]